MVTVNKTIENLKPGKQYLVTVRPKDADLNLALNPVSAIRFTVPDDATKPADLSDLVIVGNYKSIMISFNPSNEADLRGYNYQVYLPENIALSGSAYVIVNNATPYLSGFSASNVITLDVPQNSETTNNVDSSTGVTTTTTTEKLYFARVQSVDTTGNLSNFTPIVASTATTLIDSAHIVNLTASKITAGTIGAHTITMAGGTSVIKSSTFNGVDVGGGSYANATTGWLINGSGRAYFYDATIAGSIDIGGFDSGSFHVDADGNLWLGSGTLVNAPFKVLKEGDVTANTITAKNLTLIGNTVLSSSDPGKIYLGVGEYSNTNTPFYVDSASQFSLGNKLTWDNSTLTITGNVNITGGNTLTLINEVQEDANIAYNTAINAQGIAITANSAAATNATNITAQGILITTAQNTANDAQDDADAAQATASTKITAGGAAFDINGNSTTISGNKIRTGTLVASNDASYIDLNSGYFAFGNGRIYWEGGALNVGTDAIFSGDISGARGTFSGSISTGDFRVDPSGSMHGRNVTIDAGLRYRCEGAFGASNSTTTARINNPGGVEALCSAASQRKYKYNIENITNALDILKTVRPRIFNWKIDAFDQVDPWTNEPWTDQARALNEFNKSYGFIAEEMMEDQPLLTVYQSPDPSLPRDQPGGVFDFSAWEPKMWKEMDFIPLLVKAVQELSAKVVELEARLNT